MGEGAAHGIANITVPLRPAPQPRMWNLAGMQLTTAPHAMVYIQNGRKMLKH